MDPLPEGERRCAQPPYDTLPIPRADIPAGILLSREADAWLREERIDDVALPLYEGRMVGQFDFSQKGWVSGKGRGAVWRSLGWDAKRIEPQFLMGRLDYLAEEVENRNFKVTLMDVTSSTNSRTVIATSLPGAPCGHKTPTLTPHPWSATRVMAITGILNSLVFDFQVRARLGGNSLIWSVLAESAMARPAMAFEQQLSTRAAGLALGGTPFAGVWLQQEHFERFHSWRGRWRVTDAARAQARAEFDAALFGLYGMSEVDASHVLEGCGHRAGTEGTRPSKGFWRIDKDRDPELRHTVLTLVAFQTSKSRYVPVVATARRASRHSSARTTAKVGCSPRRCVSSIMALVTTTGRSRPSPSLAAWVRASTTGKLAQSTEESWRECHLHARNLLGEGGYRRLLAEIGSEDSRKPPTTTISPPDPAAVSSGQGSLFE